MRVCSSPFASSGGPHCAAGSLQWSECAWETTCCSMQTAQLPAPLRPNCARVASSWSQRVITWSRMCCPQPYKCSQSCSSARSRRLSSQTVRPLPASLNVHAPEPRLIAAPTRFPHRRSPHSTSTEGSLVQLPLPRGCCCCQQCSHLVTVVTVLLVRAALQVPSFSRTQKHPHCITSQSASLCLR